MWDVLLKLLFALILLGIGSLVGSWLAGVARLWLERTSIDPLVRQLIVRAVWPIAMVIAVVAAADRVGVDLTGALALFGAGAIAVGLALQASLSNVAAGALLLTLRPFGAKDSIEVAGQTGKVLELGLFTTRIRTADGVETMIPNQLVLSGPIRNLSRHGLRRTDLRFRVAVKADLGVAREAVIGAMTADQRVRSEPAPAVLVVEIDARGVLIAAQAWVTAEDLTAASSDLSAAIHDALKTKKIALGSQQAILQVGE